MPAWVVTPNLVTLNVADVITGWTSYPAATTATNVDTDVNVQGTGCMAWGLKSIDTYWVF